MIPYPIRALTTGALVLTISASAAGTASAAPGDAIRALHAQTRTDLDASMRGEAYAYASYSLFAEQARKQGLASVDGLFQRTAKVELGEHFTEEAALSGLVGSNAANLRAALQGEAYESQTMYRTFAKQARQDGDTSAAEVFDELARDEAAHHAAFTKALEVVRTGKGSIPAPPAAATEAVQAGAAKVRAPRTRSDLDTAMRGEALAAAKYTQFAKAASAHGDQALARLFNGVAEVELREHFAGMARLAGTVGTTRENLTKAITGERYESGSMYPAFARRARAAGDSAAAQLFAHNAEDEAAHARSFETARSTLR
ncbi:ferritin family protein [Streptomyces sp. NPDC007264]|uniref:ferritin family protein n=1 Tax=Streptomyces sp. NPDC007264 TaxID=3364777 RepID=UPI0036DC6923